MILTPNNSKYVVSAKDNTQIKQTSTDINPHELQNMNLIMYPKYCPIHQRIVQTYKNIELSPPQITEIDYSESTISMVTNSNFVTVLPESMAKNKVNQNQERLILKKFDITFLRNVSLFARSKQKLNYLNKLK